MGCCCFQGTVVSKLLLSGLLLFPGHGVDQDSPGAAGLHKGGGRTGGAGETAHSWILTRRYTSHTPIHTWVLTGETAHSWILTRRYTSHTPIHTWVLIGETAHSWILTRRYTSHTPIHTWVLIVFLYISAVGLHFQQVNSMFKCVGDLVCLCCSTSRRSQTAG